MTTMENTRARVEMVKNDAALIRLTENNKEKLLGEILRSARSRKAEASEILENLKRLAPHWAPFLTLKDVAVDAAPLRLMCSLDSELLTDSSADMGSYIAVSYCWRNPGWKPIVNEVCEPWNFSEPMVKSLLQLRESADEGIWFDEKCIDQSKEDEKQVAIGAMDVIYRSARRIVILLEDVQFSHETQTTLLKFSDDLSSSTTYTQGLTGATQEEVSVLANAFYSILSARWFSRAWCVHEFRIINHFSDHRGIRPTFLVMGPTGEPAFRVPLISLITLAGALSFHHEWDSFGSYQQTSALRSNFVQLVAISPIQMGRGTTTLAKGKVSYMQEYMQTTKQGISEPQDRVQIALNLCDLPIACSMGGGFKLEGHCERNPELTEAHAEVRLLDTCYSLFSCISMAASDFSVLASIGRPLSIDSSNEGSKPWLRYLQEGELTASQAEISPQCIASLEVEYIDLDLLFLPGDLEYASPSAKAFAKQLVTPKMAQRKIPIASYGKFGKMFETNVDSLEQIASQREDFLMPWLREMLALALDCDVKWMSSAGERMRREVMNQSFLLGDTRLDECGEEEPWLRDTALQMLSFKEQSQDFSIDDGKDRQYTEEQILPIMRFLDLVTDPRIRYTTFGDKLGRIVSPKSEGPRETLGMLRGLIPVKRIFAIPVALSSKDYIVATKVWVLQSVDTPDLEQGQKEQAWKVVDKLALLFEHVDGIKDGVNGVRLEHAQRVYGAPFWWENPHHYGLAKRGEHTFSYDGVDD